MEIHVQVVAGSLQVTLPLAHGRVCDALPHHHNQRGRSSRQFPSWTVRRGTPSCFEHVKKKVARPRSVHFIDS